MFSLLKTIAVAADFGAAVFSQKPLLLLRGVWGGSSLKSYCCCGF